MGGLEGLAFQDFSAGNSYSYADGRVGVDVQYKQGAYQVVGERWFLVNDGGTWKLTAITPITPTVEGDTTVVGVNLVDYGFEFNVSSIVETEVLMLHAINAGAEPHEIVVLREPEGMTLDQITAIRRARSQPLSSSARSTSASRASRATSHWSVLSQASTSRSAAFRLPTAPRTTCWA